MRGRRPPAGETRHPVALKAGAIHHDARVVFPGRRRHDRSAPGRRERDDFRAGHYASAALRDPRREPLAHPTVVHDSRLGDVERFDSRRMRLDLAEALRREALAPHPVGGGALVQPLESPALRLVQGHDHLATDVVGNSLLGAEPLHRRLSRAAVRGLQRSRPVIDSRVEDAGVAPGLVKRDRRLLLENYDGSPRSLRQQTMGGGQAEDPAAHDEHVALRRHPIIIASQAVVPPVIARRMGASGAPSSKMIDSPSSFTPSRLHRRDRSTSTGCAFIRS